MDEKITRAEEQSTRDEELRQMIYEVAALMEFLANSTLRASRSNDDPEGSYTRASIEAVKSMAISAYVLSQIKV